jgi:hypothetical protein
MNPYIPTGKALDEQNDDPNCSVKIHCIGGLGWAGLFGGPVAISFLVYKDLVALGREDLLKTAAIWYGLFILIWLYFLLSTPPDLISQWIPFLPQTILWWIVARHLFGSLHSGHRMQGGLFFSRWRSIRFGFFTFLVLKLIFFVIAVVFDL